MLNVQIIQKLRYMKYKREKNKISCNLSRTIQWNMSKKIKRQRN